MAEHVLHASAQSVSGYAVRCESRGFSYLLDEAIEDGGTDSGMTPLESLMASMGACKCITARAAAKLRKIDLSEIRIDVDGELGRRRKTPIAFCYFKFPYQSEQHKRRNRSIRCVCREPLSRTQHAVLRCPDEDGNYDRITSKKNAILRSFLFILQSSVSAFSIAFR